MCDDKARLREAYVAAVQSLPPLVRAVFLLHRIDDLSYRRIATRLSIDDELAMRCVGRALYAMVCHIEGYPPSGPEPPLAAETEAILHKEYMAYRARLALRMARRRPPPLDNMDFGPRAPICWWTAVGRWFRLHRDGRHFAEPPPITFDEWLRCRNGPPGRRRKWRLCRALF